MFVTATAKSTRGYKATVQLTVTQDYELELTREQLLELAEDNLIGPFADNTEEDLKIAAEKELWIDADLIVEDELNNVFPATLKGKWSEYSWRKIEDYHSSYKEHKFLLVDEAETVERERAEFAEKMKADLAEYQKKRMSELHGDK